jgi:alpha-N-acetylglucosamine transferase
MITSDGACLLTQKYLLTSTKVQTLTFRSLKGLQPATIHSLSTAGMKVVTVRRMKKADIRDMSEERWNDNYTKLRLWQLAYERIIFLDSDMLVLQVRSLLALLADKYKC